MADDQDRTLALLGIAAAKKTRDEPCPPENIMSAFIENRLDPETHAMMLSHLNRCEDCYLTWENLGVFMAQNNVQAMTQHKAKKSGLRQRFEKWCNFGFTWQIAVPVLAVASLATVLVVNLSDTRYQNNYSDPSMAAVKILDADMLASSINQFSVPWKDHTFGFNKSTVTKAAKSVGVGIWEARNTAMKSNDPLPAKLLSEPAIDWEDSEWRDYYAFGQWTLNTWVLAHAEHIKPSQWDLLRQSLLSLETALKRRQQFEPEAEIALQTIDNMKTSLDRLSRNVDLSAQSALLREIELGLQKIFL